MHGQQNVKISSLFSFSQIMTPWTRKIVFGVHLWKKCWETLF